MLSFEQTLESFPNAYSCAGDIIMLDETGRQFSVGRFEDGIFKLSAKGMEMANAYVQAPKAKRKKADDSAAE